MIAGLNAATFRRGFLSRATAEGRQSAHDHRLSNVRALSLVDGAAERGDCVKSPRCASRISHRARSQADRYCRLDGFESAYRNASAGKHVERREGSHNPSHAKPTFWRMPPESSRGYADSKPSRPTISISLRARSVRDSAGTPRAFNAISTFWLHRHQG